jgi:hypothetical protein
MIGQKSAIVHSMTGILELGPGADGHVVRRLQDIRVWKRTSSNAATGRKTTSCSLTLGFSPPVAAATARIHFSKPL